MALFRHIAFRQTGSLDLSHWWRDPSTFDGNGIWLGRRSTSRHCLRVPFLTRFAPPVRFGERSRWEPPLYDYLSLFAPSRHSGTSHTMTTLQQQHISSPGVSLP